MKSSTGSGTEECEIRESSSAAIWRAALAKSTPLFIVILVPLSMSEKSFMSEQKPILAACSTKTESTINPKGKNNYWTNILGEKNA